MSHQEAPELRYVVLRHEGIEPPHYDLLFETAPGSMLSTWRSAKWPLEHGTPLTALPDHRRLYLEYEGPLSGNRGTVRRIEHGRHSILQNDPGILTVRLENGAVLHLPRQPAPQDPCA